MLTAVFSPTFQWWYYGIFYWWNYGIFPITWWWYYGIFPNCLHSGDTTVIFTNQQVVVLPYFSQQASGSITVFFLTIQWWYNHIFPNHSLVILGSFLHPFTGLPFFFSNCL
jgi:hypothetical protein